MKGSYLNDSFFNRLETLSLELRADLAGFFGGKHLVRTYGQTVEFADYREYTNSFLPNRSRPCRNWPPNTGRNKANRQTALA